MIDPETGVVIENGTVAWADGLLTDVSEARGDPPEGAIDLEGKAVLPGLIDAHVHLISDLERSPGFGPPPQLHGEDPRPRELGYLLLAQSCAALLEAGITTVRDVGSYDDEAIVMRRAIELGLVRGPTVRTCGRIISATSPGGKMFGTMYVEADGPWAMRRAVREQLRRGADYVKFMSTGARSVEREDPEPAQLTREEIAALIDEAHRLGLRVAAHAEGLEGARLAIEEGVDTVEHGFSLHREPRLLALMAERGQVLVPTLTTFHDLAERFAPQWLPRLVDQAKRQLEEAYLTLGAARDAGVTLAMGFDSGPPGANLWELVRMAEGGSARWTPLPPRHREGRLLWGFLNVAASRRAQRRTSWSWTVIRSRIHGCCCDRSGSGSSSATARASPDGCSRVPRSESRRPASTRSSRPQRGRLLRAAPSAREPDPARTA